MTLLDNIQDSIIFKDDFYKELEDKASSWYVAKEFEDNTYGMRRGDIEGKVALDLGMDIGSFSTIALEMGASAVVAVEPNELLCDFMAKKSFEIGINNLTILNTFVWSNETDKLKLDFSEPMSVGDAVSNIHPDGESGISFKRLMSIMPEEFLLKIDIEGAEYEIFKHLKEEDWLELARRCPVIYFEFHIKTNRMPGYNQKEITNLMSLFESLGYDTDRLNWLNLPQYGSLPSGSMFRRRECSIKKVMTLHNTIYPKSKKVSIIIPTFNHCNDLLKPCIDSLLKYTDMSDKELIVVANGCTDNTIEYLNNLNIPYDQLKVVEHRLPQGYPKAVNMGANVAVGEYLVFLNNDTVLMEQSKDSWIDRMIDPMIDDSNIGVIGPCVDSVSHPNYWFVIFFCAATRKDLFYKLGMLNEGYGMGAGEDMEYSFMCKIHGYKVEQCSDSNGYKDGRMTGDYPIWHIAEGTMHDEKNRDYWINEHFQKNIQKIDEKFYKEYPFKLAILITAFGNNDYDNLKRIIGMLKNEIDMVGGAYFLIDYNTEISIGEKRQRLLDSVNNAEYICYIDSDDLIAPDYIRQIYKAMATKPDCIGTNPVYARIYNVNGSTDYSDYDYEYHSERSAIKHKIGNDELGSVWISHKDPTRTTLAKKVKWNNFSHWEDHIRWMKLIKYVHTCVQTEWSIYTYLDMPHSAAKDNPNVRDHTVAHILLDSMIRFYERHNKATFDDAMTDDVAQYIYRNLPHIEPRYEHIQIETLDNYIESKYSYMAIPEWRRKLGYKE